jgi:hypothetical protein
MEIKAMAGQRQNGGGGVNGPAASTNPAAAIAAAGGTYSGALQRAAATASKTTTTIGVANALPSSCGMQSANATVGSGGGDIIYHEDCLLVGCIRKDVHSLGDILQVHHWAS